MLRTPHGVQHLLLSPADPQRAPSTQVEGMTSILSPSLGLSGRPATPSHTRWLVLSSKNSYSYCVHQIVTFPECLILLNILHIWLDCFRDATEYRKGIKFKALGCTPKWVSRTDRTGLGYVSPRVEWVSWVHLPSIYCESPRTHCLVCKSAR